MKCIIMMRNCGVMHAACCSIRYPFYFCALSLLDHILQGLVLFTQTPAAVRPGPGASHDETPWTHWVLYRVSLYVSACSSYDITFNIYNTI